MTKGKHRAPSKLENAVSHSGEFAAAGSAMAVLLTAPILLPGMADAAPTGILDEIARCESSNDPNVVNSSGHGGLFQFDAATWRSVGGAGLPQNATVAEQYKRASLLLNSRGTQPWNASKSCWGKKFSSVGAGSTGSTGTRVTVTSKSKVPTAASTPKAVTAKPSPAPRKKAVVVPEKVVAKTGVAAAGSYVVKSGDTLSGIAVSRGTTWRSLYMDNQDKISNPDLIYPGQVLDFSK